MKKIFTCFLFGLIFVSCRQSITDKDLTKINGYWEIQNVNLPDGTNKDYKVNETIDYFKVKNNKGFRQKVMPQLDGKYLTNNIKETISISKEKENFYINYATNYSKWSEEIIEIRDSILVLKNDSNVEYHYKRQLPFTLK